MVFAVSGDPVRARQIADAIVDWRSPSASPSIFDQYYFSLGPTFRARHASFVEIEELLLVQGMSRVVLRKLHHWAGRASLRARQPARLSIAVGIAGSIRCKYGKPRAARSHGHAGGGDRGSCGAPPVAGNFGLSQETGPLPPRIAVYNGFTIYTLRASARLRRPDGTYSEVVRTAAATIKLFDPTKAPRPMEILRWYDDAWSQAAIPPYPGMAIRGGNVPGQPGFAGDAQP